MKTGYFNPTQHVLILADPQGKQKLQNTRCTRAKTLKAIVTVPPNRYLTKYLSEIIEFSSKQTSNRVQNRRQIEFETDVKSTSKQTLNRIRSGRPSRRSTLLISQFLRPPLLRRRPRALNHVLPGPVAAAAATKNC